MEINLLNLGDIIKNLIIINGTMGVGKTTVSRELQKILEKNVFLDGEWCWDMKPFVVSDETKEMVMKNICFTLNSFIECSEYQNIIFCWVLHQQKIIDDLLSRLNLKNCNVRIFTLTANAESLTNRLSVDVKNGIRTADVIERSIPRIKLYEVLKTEKINTDNITAKCAAEIIAKKLK